MCTDSSGSKCVLKWEITVVLPIFLHNILSIIFEIRCQNHTIQKPIISLHVFGGPKIGYSYKQCIPSGCHFDLYGMVSQYSCVGGPTDTIIVWITIYTILDFNLIRLPISLHSMLGSYLKLVAKTMWSKTNNPIACACSSRNWICLRTIYSLWLLLWVVLARPLTQASWKNAYHLLNTLSMDH